MTETHPQIGIDQAGLGSILKQYKLKVPSNQREYSWTDAEVQQLFHDIARAIQDSDYFLGTIVTIPRDAGELEVVDGQQRLATTAIFLAAVRDYLRTNGEDTLVEAINNEFLTHIDRTSRSRVANLTLNIDDNDLFNQIVTGTVDRENRTVSRDSHIRLLAAYDQAREYVLKIVGTADPKDHGDFLNRWVSYLELNAQVILLRVPGDSDAYRMFETLNDRGLRTSQVDLIKNYLFGRSGTRFGEVQTHWAYMRGALDSLDEDDITLNFIRHALIVLRGHLTSAEVYAAVQDSAKAQQGAVTLASTLDALATVYVATFNPDHERWNTYPASARRSLEVFNLFDIRPLRALLLATAAKMEQKQSVQALQFLVTLGVRLLIASTTRSSAVEVPLANAAKAVYEGSIATALQLRTHLMNITPSDKEFSDAFARARVSNARQARYYLRSLEMQAQGDPDPWYVPQGDPEVINLEHVLPKKPQDNWPQFSEDDRRLLTTRLGNLALLRAPDNGALQSDAFDNKRAVYAASPYSLTSEIAEVAEWGREAIEHRQVRLAALAVKVWTI